jgi:penicillin-binding protein 1C
MTKKSTYGSAPSPGGGGQGWGSLRVDGKGPPVQPGGGGQGWGSERHDSPGSSRERALRRVARGLKRCALVACGLGAAAGSALLAAVYLVSYPVDTLAPDRGGPLVITDRDGVPLRSLPSADGRPGRAAWVPLDRVPAAAVLAIIASEDHHFYRHRGVDGRGVARAAWLNLRNLRLAYGGSTITMQLVRMADGPDKPRTLRRKVSEAVRALRLERAMDKRAILEQYVNRAYYGNGAYGLEAAAQRYFGKPAAALSVGEATLLAVVPRAPRGYDPLRNLDAALRRRDHVLSLLAARGLLEPGELSRARAQPVTPRRHAPPHAAPHFTDWVLASLPAEVRARGGTARTTLDGALQRALEERVAEHAEALRPLNLQHAGVVVLDTATGEVLAMVGSAGWDLPGGQINAVTRRRHPGSALKPFVYAAAIEAGDSPATITYDVHDVPSAYVVRSAPEVERGPVRYRDALAGSYNLAAVHVLERVGVARTQTMLRRAGAGELAKTPDDYGLRLALGSAKVRLLDLAAAYGFLVRDGRVRAPVAVLSVTDDRGRSWRPLPAAEVRVASPETSWLVMDMLADGEARARTFGPETPFDHLPFTIAAKTGTARGFADTIAVGVTRELTVGAWAGTYDGTPTQGLTAMATAAPLVRDGFLAAARERPLTLPPRPAGVVTAEVCPLSGARPSPDCPHRKRDHFVAGTVPDHACDWHHAGGVRYPPALAGWERRLRQRGGRHLAARP